MAPKGCPPRRTGAIARKRAASTESSSISAAARRSWSVTGSSFNNASINGTYTGGSDYPEDANAGTEADSLTGDGAGNFTGSSQTDNQRGPQENPITRSEERRVGKECRS